MIKKPSLASSNSVCYSFYGEEVEDVENTYITESMFVIQRCKVIKFKPKVTFEFLLILSCDIETCPCPAQRSIPELESSLSCRGMYIFHQNVALKLILLNVSKANFRFLLLRKHIQNVMDYGDNLNFPWYDFVSKPEKERKWR